MHSYECSSGTVFNFNSDLSGLVRIYRQTADGKEHEIWVPGEDLVNFIITQHAIPSYSRYLERRMLEQLMR